MQKKYFFKVIQLEEDISKKISKKQRDKIKKTMP